MAVILALLRVRLLSLRNTLLRSNARERRRARMGLLFTVVVIVGVATMAYGFFLPFALLAPTNPQVRAVLVQLPAFACFSVFWMLLLSAVTVGIQVFYLSQEFTLLLSAPAPPRGVFLAKFVDATAANAALFLTIGAPALLAYAFAWGSITAPFVIQLVLVLCAFSALPTGLGLLFSFVLMRMLPANRTRDILAALGIAAFALVYVVFSVNARRIGDPGAVRDAAGSFATVLARPVFHHGPWAWAGEALNGELGAAEVWYRIAELWLVAAVAVALTALAAQWVHARGWAAAQEAPSTGHTVAPVGQGWESRLARLPGPVRAVFLKDLRCLRRDMRQLSMFFIPLAVVVVFLLQYRDMPGEVRIPPVLFFETLFVVLGPIAFRLAMSAFVTETRAVWMVLAAPSDPLPVLVGKFLYAYGLSLPIVCLVTVAFAWLSHMGPFQALLSAGLALCGMAGCSGIGVGASALFADFTAENARFTVSAAGRFLAVIVQVVFVAIVGVITAGAWFLSEHLGAPPILMLALSSVAVLGVSAAFVTIPLLAGARRFRRMEL